LMQSKHFIYEVITAKNYTSLNLIMRE
jgi:hypothetical protein